MSKIFRRQFLQFCQYSGLFALAAFISSNRNPVKAIEIGNRFIELNGWSFTGEPLAAEKLKLLYFLDLNDEPLPTPPQKIETGKIFSELPPEQFAITMRMMVDGFGEVALYADNSGKGYTSEDFPFDLNRAFTLARWQRVTQFIEEYSARGFTFSPKIKDRLNKAKVFFDKVENALVIREQLELCRQSLVESLWAGEEAVLEKARQQINQNGDRSDFLFGCNLFGYPHLGEKYNDRFKELFNYATLPFYWGTFEPTEGKPDFDRIDNMVSWLQANNIKAKGHPLVYFHEAGIPSWIKDRSWQEIKTTISDRVGKITEYYRGKIDYFDIINEANNLKWANDLKLSYDQFLEVTKIASIASRQGNPEVRRIINHCCLWAENVPFESPPQMSPYQYLKGCISADIDFEILGMQVYYPNQDMFEIDRLLEKFSKLGKKIQISELGVASNNKTDSAAMIQEPFGFWHEPWSEKIQADWIEQFYTICYSKSFIEAITWWDFADGGQFWPHGGLLKQDLQPKESYSRLLNLRETWGKAKKISEK
jgi:endo-1,4-beta-xylanase